MKSDHQRRKAPHGSLLRMLTHEQRLPIRMGRISHLFAPGRFVWVSADATPEVLGRLSRGCREFFRIPTGASIPYFRSPVNGDPLIGECELVAAEMASLSWDVGSDRNIAMCSDNQNVMSWVGNARSQSPVASRILKAVNLFFLHNEVDVLPAYVRSERNIFADGLTRWAQIELEDWVSQELMAQIDVAARLWAGMALSYNHDMDVAPPPNASAILWRILHFPRSYNYRVCEWRPIHLAVANVLGNRGVPVYIDQVLDIGVRDLRGSRNSRPLSVIGDKDIFILICYCPN